MRQAFGLVALAVLAAWPGWGVADADGPDFYRVRDVPAGESLAIRTAPAPEAEQVGALPHDADGIRNLLCEGRLSFGEWETASEDERAVAADRVWCRIEYGTLTGWVRGRHLAEGSPP